MLAEVGAEVRHVLVFVAHEIREDCVVYGVALTSLVLLLVLELDFGGVDFELFEAVFEGWVVIVGSCEANHLFIEKA